ARVQLTESLVEDRVQTMLLGVEVVVEGGGSDADVVGDVRPLRVLIPVAAEPVDSRVENLGSPDAFVAGPACRPRTPTVGGLIRTHVRHKIPWRIVSWQRRLSAAVRTCDVL